MIKGNMLRWLNLGAFMVMVVINILASTTILGGVTTAQVSDRYQNLFTPSGITFSIWGVIYAVIGIALVMNLFKHNNSTDASYKSIGMWFIVTCFLNILWIFMWQYNQILLSTIIIIMLLMAMFALYFRSEGTGLFHIGVGIYTGWISVATIASLFVLASSFGFDMFSTLSQIVTIIFIVSVSILAGLIGYKINSMYYTLSALWAVVGIMIKHLSYYNANYKLIIAATIVGIIAITIFMINTIKEDSLQNFNSKNIFITRR